MHCRYSFTSMEMRYAVLVIDYFDVLNEFLRGRPLIGHVGKLIAIPVGKVMEGNTSIHFCSTRTLDIFTYMKSIRTVTIIIYNLQHFLCTMLHFLYPIFFTMLLNKHLIF